eukprot:g14954.t1
MAQHIPQSTITIKPGDQPWFNVECSRACQEQHQAYLKMWCQPGEDIKQDYLHAKHDKQQMTGLSDPKTNRLDLNSGVLPHPVMIGGRQFTGGVSTNIPILNDG